VKLGADSCDMGPGFHWVPDGYAKALPSTWNMENP